MHTVRACIVCTAPSPSHYFSPKPAVLELPIDDVGWAHWEERWQSNTAFLLCFACLKHASLSTPWHLFSSQEGNATHLYRKIFQHIYLVFFKKGFQFWRDFPLTPRKRWVTGSPGMTTALQETPPSTVLRAAAVYPSSGSGRSGAGESRRSASTMESSSRWWPTTLVLLVWFLLQAFSQNNPHWARCQL